MGKIYTLRYLYISQLDQMVTPRYRVALSFAGDPYLPDLAALIGHVANGGSLYTGSVVSALERNVGYNPLLGEKTNNGRLNDIGSLSAKGNDSIPTLPLLPESPAISTKGSPTEYKKNTGNFFQLIYR